MIATNAQINTLVATLLGRDVAILSTHAWELNEDGSIDDMAYASDYHNGPRCERCGEGYCVECGETPTPQCHPFIPLYCQDKNAQSPLLTLVRDRERDYRFGSLLSSRLTHCLAPEQLGLEALLLDARTIVVLALQAIDEWPADWEVEP